VPVLADGELYAIPRSRFAENGMTDRRQHSVLFRQLPAAFAAVRRESLIRRDDATLSAQSG
jgi:hypothetical protein